MKRFDRYILSVFAQSLVLVLALFTTVFLVVDVLLNLDKIQNFPDVAEGTTLFYAFNLPPILYLLYPFIIIAAGMFAVARLIRTRELLLLEAAGIGTRRALAAVMIPALLLGVLGLGLRQWALPGLADAARESPYGAFEFRKGRRLSLRDDEGNVWFVRRYNLDTRTLEGVRIISRDGTRVIAAGEMQWLSDRSTWWVPTSGTVQDLAALTALEPQDSDPVAFSGDVPFGRALPADFARRRRSYSDQTLGQLWTAGRKQGSDREVQTALWHELWHPLSGLILLACGVGLVTSRRGLKPMLAGSLALGAVVGYQILLFWFETLGKSGAFPPVVGAGITPVLFGVLAGVLYWRS